MMRCIGVWPVLLGGALLLAAAIAAAGAEDQDRRADSDPPTFAMLVTLAEDHLNETYPRNRKDFTLPARVTRYPGHWEVTWVLPKDVQGGTPVVILDRGTLEVLSAQFYQ